MDGGTRYQGMGLPAVDEPGQQSPQIVNVPCYCQQCCEAFENSQAAAMAKARETLSDPTIPWDQKLTAGFDLFLMEHSAKSPQIWHSRRGRRNRGDVVLCPFGNGDVRNPVRDPVNKRFNYELRDR